MIAVADALAYAHHERIIHRDLKPANVLVGDFGETVVIDWGLAKDLGAHTDPKESLELRLHAVAEETLSGSVVGTPAYMPPEQARGESVDQRADVYALGALLYKVLVGAPPYDGASSRDVLEQVKAGPPVPVPMREPGAPPDLVAIVAKAMARDPADRYADAGELAQDLELFETGQLVAAHRYTVRQLAWRWLRRHRWAIGTGVAAVVALAVVATLSVERIVAERARAEAGRRALQEERGRIETLEGRSGMALAYLVGAAEDRVPGGARGFLIAEAMRAFEPERAHLEGKGRVVVAATADGRRVATSATGAVTLWQGTARVRTFPTPGEVDALAFDPGGAHLIAGGHDGVARVWAVDDPAHVRELHAGDAPIRALEVSPDGNQLVTASDDGRVRIWDLASSTFIDVACHAEPVVSAHFAPAGTSRIVTASADHTACVIDAANGNVETLLRGHTDALTTAVWSPDGAWVITASTDGTARVWAAEHGKLVLAPLRHESGTAIRAVALSRDGQRVVTTGDDGLARIWELPPVTPDEAEAAAAAGTPRSARLLVALDGHAGPILSVQFAPDQRRVATGDKDGIARVWDAETGELVAAFEHGEAVDDLTFTGSGTLVTGSSDGTARIWQVPERTHHDLFSPVHAIAVASDGTIAAGTDDSRVRMWRAGNGAPEELGQLGRVFALAFTPDGHHLVVAGDDRRPSVWDVRTHEQLLLGEHASAIHAVAIAPDASVVATVTDDDHVRLWSLADGRLVRDLSARGVVVNAIAISPDGALLVAGLDDGTLARWRLRDGVLLGVQPATSGAVTALAFTPSGGSLAVGGHSDARLYAVDGLEVGELPAVAIDGPTGEVRAFAFACAGHCVLTAGTDGLARVWDAEKGKLLGTRGARGAPLGALAVAGETLWVASEANDGWIGAWNVRSDVRPLEELRAFFLEKHVPWALDRDDVVRRRATRAR